MTRDNELQLTENGYKKIITFWGVGSVGKTTMALTFAQTFAKIADLKVGLLDFAVLTPSIHLFLDTEDQESTIEFVLKSWQDNFSYKDILEENAIKTEDIPNLLYWTGLTKHPELIEKLGPNQAKKIISDLSEIVDVLIIDVQSDTLIIPTDIALKMATDVIVVVDQNRNVIENTAKWLNNLSVRQVGINKFHLLINQYSNKAMYTKEKIEKNLGLPLLGTIPAIPKVKYDNLTVTLDSLLKYREVSDHVKKASFKLHKEIPLKKKGAKRFRLFSFSNKKDGD
ncbi:hypothetical protein A7K50_01230 [Dehalobacter sp. MCB1]|uniref:AAA family ATPase n=1 Tax=unclassified Dehalobacter TaxID=2635733 RepID=UPI000E6CE7F9|nr:MULTISPECIES: P-loop NTPase [unclassified Dehalobacter]RJE47896.1 hypothetical protein A7K50_01230 [Dehalobacter sp. MCB1]TCX56074.1 hypothetical protein C1I38_00710 [Dehalobacter sp. 12DCB1]